MKRIIGVIFSALLFGLIAGGMMVGVNYIAQERNIYSIAEAAKAGRKEGEQSFGNQGAGEEYCPF